MRLFYLEDDKGRRLDLNRRPHYFNSPQGLGIETDFSYGNLTEGFFFASGEDRYNQVPITGRIIFIRDGDVTPYSAYSDFAAFLASARELYFVYAPEQKEYYRPVKIGAFEKGEYDRQGILSCGISLLPLSPWRAAYPLAFNLCTPETINNKTYSYKYPYIYSASSAKGEVQIIINGTADGSLRMEADGRLLNPILEAKRAETGELLGRINLTGVDIAEGEKLIYSSEPNASGIWRRKADGETEDLIDMIDLADRNFIAIPPNEPILASFKVSNAIDRRITLYAYEYWRSA